MNEGLAAQPPSTRSRSQLWLLALMFFAPLALSFLLYYGGNGWRPAGSTNRGELIDPARALPEVPLATPAGVPTSPDFFHGKWSLVYAANGACDERCRKALNDSRQVRLALNQDSSRVQRVFLYTGACCEQEYFVTEQAGLLFAAAEGDAGRKLLGAFPVYGGVDAIAAGRLYVVDPLGNLMMSYPADAPAKSLLDDLKKLLKLSQIG